MQITVRILGGVMDEDRVTSVRGDQLTLTDHGKIRRHRRLTPGVVAKLERLANEVADLRMPSAHPKRSTAAHNHRNCGRQDEADRAVGRQDAPEPVWALLSAIEALDRDTESSQY